jgi:hypothetical protein
MHEEDAPSQLTDENARAFISEHKKEALPNAGLLRALLHLDVEV